jgi:hypothetical protein
MGGKSTKPDVDGSVSKKEQDGPNGDESADDRILQPGERVDYPEEHITTDSSASAYELQETIMPTTTTTTTTTASSTTTTTASSTTASSVGPDSHEQRHQAVAKSKSAVVRGLVGESVHQKKVARKGH